MKHESATFAAYALGHVTDHLGGKLVVEITPTVVKRCSLDKIAARHRAANEKRESEAERQTEGVIVSQAAVVQ